MKKLSSEDLVKVAALGRKFSDATVILHSAIAARAGLSGADHKYMGLLLQRGTMPAGELARLTGLTTGAVTGMIDRLEDRGLVKRVFDRSDRRKVMVVPNEERANEIFGSSFSELQERAAGLIGSFTADEMAVIERYMTGAIAMMEEVTHQLNNK